jgi:SAM-dependent methyltransferase
MIQLGSEFSFNELLDKGDEGFHALMRTRRCKRVLDIGCEHGEALYLMHHRYDSFEQLLGWEKEPEDVVLTRLKQKDEEKKRSTSYKSLYGRYLLDQRVSAMKQSSMTEDEYRDRIRIRFKTPASTGPLKRQKFDLVVISNVLHSMYPNGAREVLMKAKLALEKGGVIYVHIRTKAHYSEEQLLTFKRIQAIIQHTSEVAGWNVKCLKHKNENGEEHFTYTNLQP